MFNPTDQYVAPRGLDTLRAGDLHHRIRTDSPRSRILFVTFGVRPSCMLRIVDQTKFEGALGDTILPAPEPIIVPPWFKEFGTLSNIADILAQTHPDPSGEGGERLPSRASIDVESRLLHIQPAIAKIHDVLSQDNPDLALNRFARACRPQVNETRFRVWFYSYVAFARNQAVLAPTYHLRGRYSRLDPMYKQSTFGRASNDGTACPFTASSTMVETILNAFQAQAKLGRTRAKVYACAMEEEFGCHTVRAGKWNEYRHKDGKPFPTEDQFWYRCELKYGRERIRQILCGKETYRNKHATSEGRYGELQTNVCQRVHADAAYSKEYPKSYVSDELLPKMAQVEIICSLSGFGVGLGFELGVETGQAYLEALFCMAIPKSLYGRLIGYEISDDDWPGYGIPASIVTDRGPGAALKILQKLKDAGIWRQMTPSNSPQSNSVVEGRHESEVKIAGAPSYKISKFTPIQMVKDKVRAMIKMNRSSSGLARASNEQIARKQFTPHEIYSDMLSRMRTDAEYIPVEDAVRLFLTKVEFNVRDDYLYLHNRPYGGAEFKKTKLAGKLATKNGTTLIGYAMNIATRFAWVEADGCPVIVEALNPFLDGDEQLFLSLDELRILGKAWSQADTALRKHRAPEESASAEQFREKAGLAAGGQVRVVGRKGSDSQAVLDEVKTIRRKR